MFLTADAVPDFVARLGARTPIAGALKAADWANIPLALRERAQFSARVESLNMMHHIQDSLAAAIETGRKACINVNTGELDSVVLSRDRFIADAMEQTRTLGLGTGTGSGGITDIGSFERLALIYDQQVGSAYGYADWKTSQDPDLLDAFPAQRLVRWEERKEPRDWEERWQEAGEACGWDGAAQDDMVALKSSPIWTELSAFDTPWPPFDYDSGMGTDDVDRDEAEGLGLLKPGEMPAGDAERDFNDELAASVSDEDYAAMQEWFGDQVTYKDGRVMWQGAP